MTRAVPTILQVLPALGMGGLEKGAVEIAGAIARSGGRAIVASRTGPLLVQLRHAGGLHVAMDLKSKSPFSVWRRARELQQLIRDEGVDLVHARSRIPAWAAWLACRREGVPMVTTWHGVHEAKWWGKRLYNSALVRGKRVIAVSEYIGRRLVEQYGVTAERLRVIPRGADPVRFDPAAVTGQRVQALVEAWNIPDDIRVIFMPARLTAWKGQGVLIEALALVKRVLPQGWVCVFAGPEGNRSFARKLEERVKLLDVREQVRFVGPCQDMPAGCLLSTVLVAPSLRPEPFGRTLVEGQMMGRPVIGTAQGAMMETVRPGETGMIVAPNDPVALAEALVTVLTADQSALDHLAENARAHVMKDYTSCRMQAATLDVYDELLGTGLRVAFERVEQG